MKTIALTKSFEALVDDEDFDWLNQWKWFAKKQPNGMFYAARNLHRKAPMVFMHRLIMEAKKGQILDHRDRNSLNNQKSNLRFCDCSENGINRKAARNNTLGFRGVRRQLFNGKFDAVLRWRNQHYYRGAFNTPEEAAVAYNELVLEHCPDFGVLNTV